MTLPRTANSPQKLLAHGTPLCYAGARNFLQGDADKVGSDECPYWGNHLVGKPFLLKLLDSIVKLLTGLLKDDFIRVSVKLFEREVSGISGMNIAKGFTKLVPALFKLVNGTCLNRGLSHKCQRAVIKNA